MRQAQFKVTQQLRMHLTLYTLKSVYIFSILFCIHFLKCWCKENLSNNQEHLEAGDHLPYAHDLNMQSRRDLYGEIRYYSH